MEIKHKKIINFFNEHTNLDFEQTIIKFIDIMETLHESMHNTMNNTMVLDILDNLKAVNNKLDNVSFNVSKINSNTQAEFAVRMSEFKKNYIDDLKMLLTCNVSDKIEPMFKEQNAALFDKTNAMIVQMIPKNEEGLMNKIDGIVKHFQEKVLQDTNKLLSNSMSEQTLNSYFSDFDKKITNTIASSQIAMNEAISVSEKRLDSKIETIHGLSETNSANTSSLNTSVKSLLNKFENSSVKGQMSENLLKTVIESLYPSACVTSVGQSKETGDIMVTRKNKPVILFENKDWGRSVVQKEVVKFIHDIESQNCCGVFLSQNGKITTKEDFEINIHNGNVLVYVHDVHNDPDKIKIAVNIIDHLKDKIEEYEDETDDKDHIPKEQVEYINAEYQNFITSKLKLTKLSKDFNKNLLKQIDDLCLPTLEGFLSNKFSIASSKFVCDHCDFVGKNQQSKSAHMRRCKAKFEIGKTNKYDDNENEVD